MGCCDYRLIRIQWIEQKKQFVTIDYSFNKLYTLFNPILIRTIHYLPNIDFFVHLLVEGILLP
jgi:hypothetical protein